MNAFLSKSLSGNPKSAIQNPKWLGLSIIAFLLVVTGAVAQAQQSAKKIPRVGFLSLNRATVQKDRVEAFREALRKLGYIEGQNITIEYRFADNDSQRMAKLAAELVHLNVDVIVTSGSSATRPAKEATTTIPIVMMSDNDPVASGFVSSLARPAETSRGSRTSAGILVTSDWSCLKKLLPSSRVWRF